MADEQTEQQDADPNEPDQSKDTGGWKDNTKPTTRDVPPKEEE